MAMHFDDERAGAVFRLLETDYLLGIRHVPLRLALASVAEIPPTMPRAGSSGPPARVEARPPSAGPPAARAPARPADRPAAPARKPGPGKSAASAASKPVASNQPNVTRLDLPADEYRRRMQQMRDLDERQVKVCRKCHLCETRTRTVFGQGDLRTRLVFVGEAPGFDEDQQGLAFVGKAGQLLTDMIHAMGLAREWVFICNILKCRPPDNRTPAPEEIQACWPYLDEQLRIIRPDVIVALGRPASQTLLRTEETIGKLRGVWHEYYPSGTPGEGESIALMPTYHPAYLLRSPGEKVKTWSDLLQVVARLNLTLPTQARN